MISNIAIWILTVNLILMVTSFIMCIWLIVIRSARKSGEKRKKDLIKAVDIKVNKFLISSSENEGLRFKSVHQYQVRKLKDLLRGNARKDIFTKRLLQLKTDLHGEFGVFLTELYGSLNLFKRSISKLRKLSISKKLEGADEIGHFNYSIARKRLKRMLHSPFLFVRQMAQLALIRMSPVDKDPLSFLVTHWKEFSEWHQLQVHAELSKNESKHNIQLEQLLLHKNIQVKIFAIRLCIFYQKVEQMTRIRSLLHNGCVEVRIWVLRAISEMGDDRDIEAVRGVLNKPNDRHEVSECLKTLSQIGGNDELEIISTYCQSEVRSHRLYAVSAIHQITGDVRSFIEGRLPKQLATTINHIKEPLNSVA